MQKYQIINSLNFTLIYLNIIFILFSLLLLLLLLFFSITPPQSYKPRDEKYKNIKNGVDKGFCSPNMARSLMRPKMERGIESLVKLVFCII
jgi:hypothetical protein